MADFSRKPRAVVCHLCGRQYGTASIEIHRRTCAAKWLEEEAKKPAHLRRPLPEVPSAGSAESNSIARMSGEELDAMNAAAFSSYASATLCACAFCGRRFAADRLEIHNRVCTAENPARRVGERLVGGGGGARKGTERPETAPSTSLRASRARTPGGIRPPGGRSTGMGEAQGASPISQGFERLAATASPAPRAPDVTTPGVRTGIARPGGMEGGGLPAVSAPGQSRVRASPAHTHTHTGSVADAEGAPPSRLPGLTPGMRPLPSARPSAPAASADVQVVVATCERLHERLQVMRAAFDEQFAEVERELLDVIRSLGQQDGRASVEGGGPPSV